MRTLAVMFGVTVAAISLYWCYAYVRRRIRR
jgi:hypothetical protein